MLTILGRARSVRKGWCGWVLVITSLLLSGNFVSSSYAQVTNLPNGGSISLSQLVGANGLSVRVGDKLFSNFGFGYIDTDLDTGDDLQPSMVVVSPLDSQDGFGLEFQLPLVAVSNVIKDVTLKFSVEVVNSINLISDAHLGFTSSVMGVATADISENISTNGFLVGSIASLSVDNPGDPPVFSDSVVFSEPQAKIWVQKDISAFAFGSGLNDRALISIIVQTFSQIPEPSTIVLSVAAVVTLFLVKRRPGRGQNRSL